MTLNVILVVVLTTINLIRAKEPTYELLFSGEDLFSLCPDGGPGTLGVHGLVDLSEYSFTLQEDGMVLSGNTTYVWDIQPQDRIKAVIKLFYFDRGTWTPTFYTVTSNDFCKSIFDPRLPWRQYWLSHITNYEDVKDKCLNPGTKVTFETFLLGATITTAGLREGLYKFRCTYQAFDANGTERPTSICYEILGNLQKVQNV